MDLLSERPRADVSEPRVRAQVYRLMAEYESCARSCDAASVDLCLLRLLRTATPRLRIEAAEWLSGLRASPPLAVRALACDADPDVARPVLRRSPAICDRTLIEMALCKGQAHLEAIAGRTNLSQRVTRILIRRGDRLVLQRLARNKTAELAPHCRRRLRARLGPARSVPSEFAVNDELAAAEGVAARS